MSSYMTTLPTCKEFIRDSRSMLFYIMEAEVLANFIDKGLKEYKKETMRLK